MRAMAVSARNQGIALMGVVERKTASLLIGAVIWSYLGIVFEILTETVAWERWEGTIEYTFMAPLSRAVHLLGMGAFAVLYGVLRTAALFGVVALFFGLGFAGADFGAAVLDGAGAGAVWGDLWPLLVLGAVAIPAGLAVFRTGERYAKRHGKLKRSG